MVFDLLTAVIFTLVGVIIAIPVFLSLLNLVIEIFVSYKDGKLDDNEARKIQSRRNALTRALLNVAGVLGISLPWLKNIND